LGSLERANLVTEFQKTGLSVQAPSSSDSDAVATVVQQIMIELSEVVSKEDRIMVITKVVLNETKWLLEFIEAAQSRSI
jgi:hypothetical protein